MIGGLSFFKLLCGAKVNILAEYVMILLGNIFIMVLVRLENINSNQSYLQCVGWCMCCFFCPFLFFF